MSDLDVKVYPRKWDSSKKAEWPTFATDFESFVELQDGEELVRIVHNVATPNSKDVLPSNMIQTQQASLNLMRRSTIYRLLSLNWTISSRS